MEEDALLAAEGADLLDGLDGADLVVGEHDGHAAGVLADGGRHVLHADDAVLVHVQQRHLIALLLQRLEGVEDGVVLKLRGDQVLFALSRADARAGDEGLVVGFAAAGCEVDLLRALRAEALRDGLAGFLQDLGGGLAELVEGGGVAPVGGQAGEQRVQRGLADAGGGCVVCVNEHTIVPFY